MNRAYLTTVDIPTLVSQIHRASVGFDTMFDRLHRTISTSQTNYPPHDIVKTGENDYAIEMALAGFKESELDITIDDNVLRVAGSKADRPDREYVHQGISYKAFTKVIPLAEHVIVREVTFVDGLLTINLSLVVPEALKPRKIEINSKVIDSK